MRAVLLISIFALMGLAVGSFVNVVLVRTNAGESVVRPGSRCPRCRTRLSNWDNIPLVSYIVLRGRCRHCHEPISLRYPLVELAGALMFLSIAIIILA